MTSLRLLYVEDNFQDVILFRSIRKKAEELLSIELKCDDVKCGFSAVEMVEKNQYDLVILDQQMSELDGLQTFEKIQQLIMARDLPMPIVFAYSNCDLSEFIQRCSQAGINEFIVKYIDAETLAKMIRKYFFKA